MSGYNDFMDDELMEVYLVEAREHIEMAEDTLLKIEKHGSTFDRSLINEIFRAVHTVKGGASFYGLDNINHLSHELESILDLIRNNKLNPGPSIMDLILQSIDKLRGFIDDHKASNQVDISELLATLRTILEKGNSWEEKQKTEEKHVKTQIPVEDIKIEKIFEDIKITRGESLNKILVNTRGRTIDFEYDYEELKEKHKPGHFIYFVYVDLIKDCQQKKRTPLDLIQKAAFVGEILTSTFHMEMVVELDGEPTNMPVYLLYQSSLEKLHLIRVLDLPEDSIIEWNNGLDEVKAIEEEKSPPALLPVKSVSAPPQETEHKTSSDTIIPQTLLKDEGKEKKAETSLRIDIKLLDKLMSLAGELVLSRNQLMQMLSVNDIDNLHNIGQRINFITTELQENIMRTRMQPIGNVFNKFPRIVRDMARNLDKQVELIIKGEEVELDKNIVENMGDPLTHLIRNAVDHGIEIPSVRKSTGKEGEGKLILSAYHEGGQVNIDITDDGAGIDANRLKARACEKGLLSKSEVDLMSERDALNLIFLPGLSTASKVTDLSGRGVGMDVVKTNFEKIGGIIDVQSESGKGTTINIKLPLTLAIIPSLLVKTGQERYAIPQMNLVELVKIKGGEVKNKIEAIHGIEVFRLRGRLLPLLRLSSVLHGDNGNITSNGQDVNIVVLAAGNTRYGLIVDGLQDSEEIVVKPLGRHMKDCKCYAGATIMGDGRVALILDIQGIANYSGLVQEEELSVMEEMDRKEDIDVKDAQSVLLFNNGTREQFAISLSLVSRIDRIMSSEIESIGGRNLLKYRGKSLPVIKIETYLSLDTPPEQNNLYMILFKIKGRDIGLIARNIVDTKLLTFDIDTHTLKQTGVLGSAIIDNCTTLFLDIFEIVEMAEPAWFKERESVVMEDNKKPSILLVEDSNFFRSHVKNYLESQGYEVIEAIDGKDGFEKLCNNRVDLIITDIEMPVMDGYSFTKKLKSDERFAHLKVMALTAMTGEEDIKKGLEAGIDNYQIKLDRENLLDAVMSFLRGDVPKAYIN
jgi:two-component system chemotaxis sensor kinase CheA